MVLSTGPRAGFAWRWAAMEQRSTAAGCYPGVGFSPAVWGGVYRPISLWAMAAMQRADELLVMPPPARSWRRRRSAMSGRLTASRSNRGKRGCRRAGSSSFRHRSRATGLAGNERGVAVSPHSRDIGKTHLDACGADAAPRFEAMTIRDQWWHWRLRSSWEKAQSLPRYEL